MLVHATHTLIAQLTGVSMLVCALSLSMDLLSRFHIHSMDCDQVCVCVCV